jgi:hypothetical protein
MTSSPTNLTPRVTRAQCTKTKTTWQPSYMALATKGSIDTTHVDQARAFCLRRVHMNCLIVLCVMSW